MAFDLLHAFGDESAPNLNFNLFEEVDLAATVTQRLTRGTDRLVLSGHLREHPGSSFTLVEHQEVLIGNIRVPGFGSFQVRYIADGVHEIREIDESKFPPCGTGPDDAAAVPAAGAAQRIGAGQCDDDGSTIDLMVVYTTEARQVQGGTAAMEALIALAETETNQAYANSEITTTSVRVVLTYETDYAESGSSSTDRSRLSGMTDGYMDEIHGLRDSVAADVVTLITNTLDGCGRAYFSISAGNVPHEELGFNVVRASCATGNYTFGHELGHNQGCRHDRAHDPSDGGAFLYSHGYYDPGNAFRTVMAVYSSTVPRIKWFSNPDVLYQGRPTGAPITQGDSAHNALTIINTAFNVANFRRTRDCNNNGACDDDEIAAGMLEDCDGNGVPDICEEDCNGNGFADECDVATGTSEDCNGNGLPDECEPSCNGNNVPDECDVAAGTSDDCNGNIVPDECEPGCNGNGVPDECDIAQGTSEDCTANGIPDECEPDCNTNGAADSCDIADLTSADVNGNGRPDECEPPILFVDAGATGANNGTSWGNAFVSLTDALVLAGESVGMVDEIWIAAGTYKPTGPNGDRLLSFDLVDGVGVYGGFAGTETSREQRDPAVNVTILSGDLNANDGPDFTNYDDNTYHVVAAREVGPTTILDGVTLTAGSADGPYPDNVGGGVVLDSASPSIVNCVFTLNYTFTAGGGLNLRDAGQPRIDRCTFLNNKAAVEGAAIGAFFTGADPIITSCVFRGNTANFGGVFFFSSATRPIVSNCTIVENTGLIDGIMYILAGSQTAINSCIVRDNTGVPIFLDDPSTVATVTYSNVQGGAAGVTTQDSATLVWGGGNIDVDPLFDTDGFHLLEGSPCIGGGDPFGDASGLDIDGEARVQHCRVDVGADETAIPDGDCNNNGQPDGCDLTSGLSQDVNMNGVPDECEPHETVYVNVSACPGLGSGTALDPYCRIQTALDAASDGSNAVVEIIVADGVYSGTGNFDLDFSGKLLTLRSENGPDNCIVDALGLGRGFYFHSAESSVSVLEGFTIRGGAADFGGGIYIHGASPVIRNCTITNCQAGLGGGIRIENGAPTIRDCTVTNNEADHGGGLSCDSGSGTIETCSFYTNQARSAGSAQGGGMWMDGCTTLLTDCTFDGNAAIASDTGFGRGGGVYLGTTADPLLLRCSITNNEAGDQGDVLIDDRLGGGIYVYQNSVHIQDSTIAGNAAREGGGVYLFASGPVLERCVIEGNTARHPTAISHGGGVYTINGDIELRDCRIRGNVADKGHGGGVYNINGDVTFTQCLIVGNRATRDNALGGSGGAFFSQSNGGTYQTDLVDCTIYGNTADAAAGGVFLSASGGDASHIFTLANSILWNNVSVADVETNQLRVDCSTCPNSIHHNCIQGWSGAFGGVGNIGTDPDFVDPDGADNVIGTGDDDLNIHAGSPVIDAGANILVPIDVVTDLAGNPRFVDDPSAPDTGNGVPPIVDMGVYEGGVDCNGNGVADPEDIANGTSEDCTGNGFPDECEPDCNENTVADSCDIAEGTSLDCNTNGVPDSCDLSAETSEDCNASLIPDECESDGDNDGVIDDCDGCPTDANKVEPGTCGCGVPDDDTDGDTVADCVDICSGFDDLADADNDLVPDGCDSCEGFDDADDADSDTVPDGCDVCSGFDDLADADADSVPDGCDQCEGYDDNLDCNENTLADGCDILDAISPDANGNGVPDECDAPSVFTAGSRYLTWTPLPGPNLIALRITSPGVPCLDHYVDFDDEDELAALGVGRLVTDPVFRAPGDWGSLHIRDERLIPGGVYTVAAETDWSGIVVQSSSATPTTWVSGDTDGDGSTSFADISQIVDGFRGILQVGVTWRAVDLRPCVPDAAISFADVSAGVDAFRQLPDPCSDPCP